MKMSEFTTKSFLGNAGAAENSYILINYEDNTTSRPVTYKASLQDIGKAIIQDQNVLKIDSSTGQAQTITSNNGAYVINNEHFVSYDGELVTSGTKMVPRVVQYNGLSDEIGYYTTENANSWNNINLGINPSAPIVTSLPNTLNNGASSGNVYPVVVDGYGTLYENSDSHVASILNIDVTHITANSEKAPIIYDLIQDQIGYYPNGTSDFTAINVGGDGGSFDPTATIESAPVRFDPETSETTETDIYPVCATRSGQLVFQDPESSDGTTLAVFQPYVYSVQVSMDNYDVLLIDSNSKQLITTDVYQNIGNIGALVYYDNDQDAVGYYVFENGEPTWVEYAPTNMPYQMEVSQWTFNYLGFDPQDGKAYITNDGDYEYSGDLGHPLFFDDTQNEIGYYKYESGERVWQAVSSLT